MAKILISPDGKVRINTEGAAIPFDAENPADCCCGNCCVDPPSSGILTLFSETGGENLTFLMTYDETDMPSECQQQWIRNVEDSTCDYECEAELIVRCCDGTYYLIIDAGTPIAFATISCDPLDVRFTDSVEICGLTVDQYVVTFQEGECPCGTCPEVCADLPATLDIEFAGDCCLGGATAVLTRACDIDGNTFYEGTITTCEYDGPITISCNPETGCWVGNVELLVLMLEAGPVCENEDPALVTLTFTFINLAPFHATGTYSYNYNPCTPAVLCEGTFEITE